MEELKVDGDMSDPDKQQFIHNTIQAKSQLYKTWYELQMIKSKMFSATPLVKEIVKVHRRQLQEEETTGSESSSWKTVESAAGKT